MGIITKVWYVQFREAKYRFLYKTIGHLSQGFILGADKVNFQKYIEGSTILECWESACGTTDSLNLKYK